MLQSQRFQQSNQMLIENQEEFANVLNTLLPEIEKELMKDIEKELAAEFQEKYQKAIEEINSQALQQYEQAIQELEQSRNILQIEKQHEIQRQIESLQMTVSKLEEQIIVKLQENFLEEHFDTRIMAHPRIEELEKQTEQQIYEALEEKHQATKQRQLKELIIAHETKEIKLRKELDQQIKSRIYCSSGLEELKQEIKQSKTQMGSQKSEYNLRLKKIEQEIKEYQDKIKEYEKMPDLEMLREKYEELKVDLLEKETQQELEKDQKRRQINIDGDWKKEEEDPHEIDEDSLDQNQDEQHYMNQFQVQKQATHQRSNSKILKRQARNQQLNPSMKFGNPQEQIDDEEYSDSQSELQIQSNETSVSRKFDLTAYFRGQLLNSQTAPITQSQNIYVQENPLQKKSLLNLSNVSDLLKQKIAMDPLEKYLNKQSVSKENDINASNLNYPNGHKSSNFAQLYEQHLKNLNKGFAKSTAKSSTQNGSHGLSQMAKKTIIKNLTTYHQNNFCHPTSENKSNQLIRRESAKTQESNLLASYK